VRVPAAVGVKVTLIVQLAPAARLAICPRDKYGETEISGARECHGLRSTGGPDLLSGESAAARETLAPRKGNNTLRFSLAKIANRRGQTNSLGNALKRG